ncbi:MAG: sulfotransferase [Chthoniobacterales bacterium]
MTEFEIGAALPTFYALYSERFGKKRWGDKTGRYLDNMALIAELLSEACFVHLVRDGRDVAVSIKELWFGPRSITDAAKRWADRIRVAREESTRLSNYIEIRYENLVRESGATLRKICQFIELPWEPALLEYDKGAR